MATTAHGSPKTESIPKRGPPWTFYVLAVLSVLAVIATVIGLFYARAAH